MKPLRDGKKESKADHVKDMPEQKGQKAGLKNFLSRQSKANIPCQAKDQAGGKVMGISGY